MANLLVHALLKDEIIKFHAAISCNFFLLLFYTLSDQKNLILIGAQAPFETLLMYSLYSILYTVSPKVLKNVF